MRAASPRITSRQTANRSSWRAAIRSTTWCSFAASGERDRRRACIDHSNDRARSSENDLIAFFERRAFANALAVDERPVLAAEVFDGEVRAVDVDSGVMARNVRRADELAPDDVFAVGERDRFAADFQPRSARAFERRNECVAAAVNRRDDAAIVVSKRRAQ